MEPVYRNIYASYRESHKQPASSSLVPSAVINRAQYHAAANSRAQEHAGRKAAGTGNQQAGRQAAGVHTEAAAGHGVAQR